nr:hypothetical protein [Methylobacterium symbioticum]
MGRSPHERALREARILREIGNDESPAATAPYGQVAEGGLAFATIDVEAEPRFEEKPCLNDKWYDGDRSPKEMGRDPAHRVELRLGRRVEHVEGLGASHARGPSRIWRHDHKILSVTLDVRAVVAPGCRVRPAAFDATESMI